MDGTPIKHTPRKRARKQTESDDDFEDEESPSKKRRLPATPSKAVQRKVERAQKTQWKLDWEKWVSRSQWKDDQNTPYKQKLNTSEIHKSDAMKFYHLSKEEMGTLPHWEFENSNNPSQPGRSYSNHGVKMLVSRKLAMLNGMYEQKMKDDIMLETGWKLFEDRLSDRCKKSPNTPKKAKTFMMRESRPSEPYKIRLPQGSWQQPIWENGEFIGHYLMCQFDPEDGYDADFPDKRFKPKGSTEWIEG